MDGRHGVVTSYWLVDLFGACRQHVPFLWHFALCCVCIPSWRALKMCRCLCSLEVSTRTYTFELYGRYVRPVVGGARCNCCVDRLKVYSVLKVDWSGLVDSSSVGFRRRRERGVRVRRFRGERSFLFVHSIGILLESAYVALNFLSHDEKVAVFGEGCPADPTAFFER